MRPEYDLSKGKRGAPMPQKGKTRISIFIDNAVLEAFRTRAGQAGIGYQTMINDVLKRFLVQSDVPLTESALRQILREEIPAYVQGSGVKPARPARKRAGG